MARADIVIDPIAGAQRSSQSSYIVKTPGDVIYAVFCSQTDVGLYWAKSTDGGFTWSDDSLFTSLVKVLGTNSGYSVWYDKWTPGNTGTIIHIAYFEQNGDDVFYRSLDTATDTMGSEITIFAGGSSAAPNNTCISITRAIGGNLYCGFDIDGGTETGFYRSVDAGANWTSRTDVNEAANTDYYLLAPGFAADTQDIICIYWDRSNSELSRKLYDDSGDSWGESSISTGMTAISSSTACPQFSITVDDANNKILLVAWTNRDTANADLRFWTIDESAITEGTNVVLNSTDDQQLCAIGLATDTTTIYVFYGGKSDGSESVGATINIYYKTSGDGGATWGAETQLSTVARNFDYLMTFPIFTGDFGAWYDSQTGGMDNLLYSALLPSGGGGGNVNLLAGKL
jgi:hypothetical protein